MKKKRKKNTFFLFDFCENLPVYKQNKEQKKNQMLMCIFSPHVLSISSPSFKETKKKNHCDTISTGKYKILKYLIRLYSINFFMMNIPKSTHFMCKIFINL